MGAFSVSVMLEIADLVFLEDEKVFNGLPHLEKSLIFPAPFVDISGKDSEGHIEKCYELQNVYGKIYGSDSIEKKLNYP